MPSALFQHIDPQVLLQAVADDPQAYCSLAATYLRIAPEILARLEAAATEQNAAATLAESHSLKGTAMLVGAHALSRMAGEIEGMVQQRQALPTLHDLAQLQRAFRLVMLEVDASVAVFGGGAADASTTSASAGGYAIKDQ